MFDNGEYDDKKGETRFGNVGLFFNMYDTFIDGGDRIIKLRVTQNKDFDTLKLEFEWEVRKSAGLLDDFEAEVFCGEDEVLCVNAPDDDTYSKDIFDAALSDHELTLTVRIHYNVDFAKRDGEKEYREMLKKSGVLLKDIRISTGASTPTQLTFGSYLNEPGLPQEEFAKRYNEFWVVSKYKKDIPYQTVVETSLRNISTASIKYMNNYSSGDIYGDMFVTKSVLDSAYDMYLKHGGENTILAKGRDYIGMGNCSNQLSLLFKETNLKMVEGVDDKGKQWQQNDTWRTPLEDEELRFQRVEVVKNINKFESAIKHKSNVFSVVVENSNLVPDPTSEDLKLEELKQHLRESITQFVRDTCNGVAPVHTQLFDVQFT